MDHIALPCDAVAHAPLEVPFLGSHDSSDGDFCMQLRPNRCAVDTGRLAEDKEPRLRLPEAAQFIQKWFWFATLNKCLRVATPNIDACKCSFPNDFIKNGSSGKVVTLTKLQEVLRGSRATMAPRLRRRIEIADSFVRQAVATLYPPEFEMDQSQLSTPIFLVLLSVQILGQTLLHQSTGLIDSVSNSNVAKYNDCTRLVDVLLSQSGWCQKDVKCLPQNIIFRYYLSYFARASCLHQQIPWIYDGETCDKQRVIQDANVTPKHTLTRCLCPFVFVPRADVDFNQSIQLYTYEDQKLNRWNSYLAEQPCQSKSNPAFVAISHVRALGLGNDDENSLPHCQLFRVQTLVNQIMEPGQQSRNTPFWLDALGLPLDRKLRKKAIHSLPSVFSRASAVLVLDPTLYNHSISLGQAEEAIIRIRYSSWKSRLWTLEEGFYAQKLMFRFSNLSVSLDDLLREIRPSLIMPEKTLNDARSTLEIPRPKALKELLSRFAADLRMADECGLSRKMKINYLHAVLRAGYLLSPRFSHLIEKNEVELQNKVMPGIFATYSSEVNLCITEASVIDRLDKICD